MDPGGVPIIVRLLASTPTISSGNVLITGVDSCTAAGPIKHFSGQLIDPDSGGNR